MKLVAHLNDEEFDLLEQSGWTRMESSEVDSDLHEDALCTFGGTEFVYVDDDGDTVVHDTMLAMFNEAGL